MSQLSDIEFLEREIVDRDQFLYVYDEHSGLLRAAVRTHAEEFARRIGWDFTNVSTGGSLQAQLNAPSLLGEQFVVCDALDFSSDDLQGSLADIVSGGCSSHVLLMVPQGSGLLEKEAWFRAKEAFGLIEEPRVTISNYRSIARFLLRRSDLVGVQDFGFDDRFLARVKAFVQEGRGKYPRSLAMELERIVLTETENGAVAREVGQSERQERRVLSEALNQFLDERCTETLHPLLQFVDRSLQAGEGTKELLGRIYRASVGIVMGRDQRYKRNREGNPAVLPYLVWSILLLEAETDLLRGNFVVAFERLCQTYHGAADGAEAWLVDDANWQAVTRRAKVNPVREGGSFSAGRSGLGLALSQRLQTIAARLNLSDAGGSGSCEVAGASAEPAPVEV